LSAGWIIVTDHPKFWARLQFICENAPEICAFWIKKRHQRFAEVIGKNVEAL